MNPGTAEPCCDTCHKPQSQLANGLKQCAKCRNQQYCSRECQKADWKKHKTVRSKQASEATSGTTTSQTKCQEKGPCYIAKPFTAINNGEWLYNRPGKDVFKLLVDTYRMRVEDQYKFEGEVEEGSLYSGASPAEALGCFRRFLTKVVRIDSKRDKKLLPDWWSQEKLKECLDFARKDDFSNVGFAVEKHDIQNHYKESMMPMQLRMFSEKLDGTMTAGASGASMLQLQMRMESGNGPAHVSHLSL